MVHLHYTKTYQEFNNLIKTLEESKKPIFIVFTGTSNESGESWCSDCVKGIVFIKHRTSITTALTNNIFCFSS